MFQGLKRTSAPAVQLVSTADAKAHLRIDDSDEDSLIDSLVKAATEKLEEHTRQAFVEQTWQVRLDSMPVAGVELPRPPLIGVEKLLYWPDLASSVLRGKGTKLVVTPYATLDQVLTGATTCRVTDTNGSFENVELSSIAVGTESTEFSSIGGLSAGTYFVDYQADASASVWSRLTAFDVENHSWPAVLRVRDDDLPDVSSDQGPPWVVEFKAGYGASAGDVPDAIVAAVKGLTTHLFEHRGEDPRQIPIPDFISYMVSQYVVPNRL